MMRFPNVMPTTSDVSKLMAARNETKLNRPAPGKS